MDINGEKKKRKREEENGRSLLLTEDDAAAEAVKKAERKAEKKRKRTAEAKAAVTGSEEHGGEGDAAPADDTAASSKADRKAAKRRAKAKAAAAAAAAAIIAAATNGSLSGKRCAADQPKHSKSSKRLVEPSAAVDASNGGASGGKLPGPGNVLVEGMDVAPLTRFDDAAFPAEIASFLSGQGFSSPTPIQSYCWPVLGGGRDIVGIAETGSGKTLAFALPGLARILRGEPLSAACPGPRMLVLAPTRELALQSTEVIAAAGRGCGVECVCVYGGVPKHEQKKVLRGGGGGGKRGNGVAVVVATPGRLKDLVSEGALSLGGVGYVVLDEADRMLDLGFENDVREIVSWTSASRQTAMFSATWPREIRELAAEFLKMPVRVTVGDDELTANVRVSQTVEVVGERERDGRLLALLPEIHGSRTNRVLVFALYKREAERLEQTLARNGWKAVAVHGDKSQNERERALGKFRDGSCPLMIATDVAARGLDIPDVEHVVNYSFPLTIADYIHRVGRTGRAGKTGSSHTFFHAGDKARAGELVNVLQEAGQPVPEALTRFGTHVKKKEHKSYGAFAKDVDMDKKATKITFDSDDE